METTLICPWSGNECPGELRCAPAVFESMRRPAEAPEMPPICPILAGVDALAMLAMKAGHELAMQPDEPRVELDERQRIIDALNIDQV